MRFLELASDAIGSTVGAFVTWFRAAVAAINLDLAAWQPLTWVLVVAAALLLVGLLWRLRPSRRRTAPELMVSHGVIGFSEESDDDTGSEVDELALAGLAAPARAHHYLSLTLSNLNPYPLQLLELAVRTRGARRPVVAEAGSVVPPHGAVDVTAELFDLPGDAGVIDLYLYSGGNRRRIWRLSAPLEWEPWTRSFRVKALAARVTGVSRLASQERRRHERRAFRGARRRQWQRELTESAQRRAEALQEQLAQRRREAEQQRAAQRAALEQAAAAAAMEQAAAAAAHREVEERASAHRPEVHRTAGRDGVAELVGASPAPPRSAAADSTEVRSPHPVRERDRRSRSEQDENSLSGWPQPADRVPAEADQHRERLTDRSEDRDDVETPARKVRLEFPDEF